MDKGQSRVVLYVSGSVQQWSNAHPAYITSEKWPQGTPNSCSLHSILMHEHLFRIKSQPVYMAWSNEYYAWLLTYWWHRSVRGTYLSNCLASCISHTKHIYHNTQFIIEMVGSAMSMLEMQFWHESIRLNIRYKEKLLFAPLAVHRLFSQPGDKVRYKPIGGAASKVNESVGEIVNVKGSGEVSAWNYAQHGVLTPGKGRSVHNQEW